MTTRQRHTSKNTATKAKPKHKHDSQSKSKESNADLKAKWTDMTNVSPLISTICMGIAFGFTLNKGRVFEPQVIMDQFQFSRWIMMKMFLSAAATSILAMSLLKITAPKQYLIARASKAKYNLMASVIGGCILGSGMTVSGACPGMVLIQIGAGVSNSLMTFVGGIVGAFVYGLTEPIFRSFFSSKTIPYPFMDDFIGNTYVLSILFSVMMFAAVFLLETLFPWKSELTTALQSNCNWLECKAWSPIVAGVIVGLIQIPSVAMLGSPIGCSTSYLVLVGQWLRVLPVSGQNIFKAIKAKINSFWQVVYVFSAIFGSMIAVQTSGTMNILDLQTQSFDGVEGIVTERSFVGGFLMIFGARIASGCTSGHGLSGMGMLSTASMIVVASMFIGGGIAGLVI